MGDPTANRGPDIKHTQKEWEPPEWGLPSADKHTPPTPEHTPESSPPTYPVPISYLRAWLGSVEASTAGGHAPPSFHQVALCALFARLNACACRRVTSNGNTTVFSFSLSLYFYVYFSLTLFLSMRQSQSWPTERQQSLICSISVLWKICVCEL